MKASVEECLNKTLKDKMLKYFTHFGQYFYHDVLEKMCGLIINRGIELLK
jgi:hypothetical protein